MAQKRHRVIEINNMLTSLRFEDDDLFRMFHTLDDSGECIVPDGTLSVSFLTIFDMQSVHKKFLNDETLTDVITFPGSSEFGLAGEICVSPEYAYDATKVYGTSFSEELTLYLVHGYLHLAGLDDIQENDIVKMREGERKCMGLLNSRNMIPVFEIKK